MKNGTLKKALCLVLCLLMIASFAACSSTSTESGETTTNNGTSGDNSATTATGTTEEYGDTIVFAIDEEPPTMCGLALLANTTSYMTMMETTQMIFELIPTNDENSENAEDVVPALVTDWTLSDDNLTWTFTCKEGMKFYDGSDLTAEDIVATLKTMVPFDEADPDVVCKSHYSSCASVDYIDDTHFSITTKEPVAALLRVLCSYSSGCWDKDLLEQYSITELGKSPETMNASGPYQLVEWVPGEYMLLEANPYYYTVSVNGKNAATKYLKVVFIPDDEARAAALESGEVDVAYGLTAETADRLKTDDAFVVTTADNISTISAYYGCNDPIIGNVKVRQALLYAVDTNAIAQNLYGDYWGEITGFTSYVCWGFNDDGHIERDLDKAKQLLAEAGYPDGFETKIYANTTGYKYVELAEALAAQFADVGVIAEVVPVESSVLNSMIKGTAIEDFNYPMYIRESGGRTREFGNMVHTALETCTDGTNSNNNGGFYSNATIDELSAKANATMDDAERKAIFQQMQHILYLEDPARLNVSQLVDIICYNAKVEGLWCNAGGCYEFDETTIRK